MSQFLEGLLPLQNYLHGDNRSSNSSCPSLPLKWCLDTFDGCNFCIQNPTLIPTTLLALLIGPLLFETYY